MAYCTKCKTKIGMFDTSYDCMSEDCSNTYCTKCSETELIDCKYCDDSFCKECLKDHEPDCKTENEEVEEEEEETCDECGELIEDCTCDELEGMNFNDDKTICMLDIDNYGLDHYINELATLLKNYELNRVLSNEKWLVWVKK